MATQVRITQETKDALVAFRRDLVTASESDPDRLLSLTDAAGIAINMALATRQYFHDCAALRDPGKLTDEELNRLMAVIAQDQSVAYRRHQAGLEALIAGTDELKRRHLNQSDEGES